MTNRIVVILEQHEYSALLDMAVSDLRNPADELRQILRLEIDRRNPGCQENNQNEEEHPILKEEIKS